MRRKTKRITAVAIGCMLALMMTSVSFAQESWDISILQEDSTGTKNATTSIPDLTETIDLSNPVSTEDGNVSVDNSDVNGAAIITIAADGVYEITGSSVNTSLVVKKGVTATLYLNNAQIDNSSYTNADPGDEDAVIEAAISCKKNSEVTILLGGSSVIKSNSSDPYMENGIKHAKGDGKTLTFSGNGTLTISGTSDDAIKYKGGTVSITEDCTLTIEECFGDGIQAEFIDISGGTTNISTAYAYASTGFYTSGSSSVSGKNTIWESGGGMNSTTTKYERVNVDTGSHKALKAGTKAESYSFTAVTEEDAEDYTAGEVYTTEASGGITISGGTLNIDTTATGLKANRLSSGGYTATATGVYIIGSPDDAIHSNNTLSITGGTVNIASSDDAISAAGSLNISGTPVINISDCYEGLEAASVTIGTSGAADGPRITINAKDDGINSASKTVSYTYDSSDNEDSDYLKTSVSSASGNDTIIYSGTVNIYIDSMNAQAVTLAGNAISYYASGDGIDCNGALDIEGGTVYVFGQTSGDNSPLDTNDGFTLSNSATVLAVGCDGMGETAPKSGNAVYLTYTGSGTSVTAVTAGSGHAAGGSMPGGDIPGNSGNLPGGNMPGNGGNTPGGSMPGNGGNLPGGSAQGNDGGMQGNGGNMPGGAASISAGQVFTVSDGSSVLLEETLPYAASYILFASPNLTAGNSYTVSLGDGSTTSGSETADNSGNTEDTGDSETADSSGNTETAGGSETSDSSGNTADTGDSETADSSGNTAAAGDSETADSSGNTTAAEDTKTSDSSGNTAAAGDTKTSDNSSTVKTNDSTSTKTTTSTVKKKNTFTKVTSKKTLKYSKLKKGKQTFKIKATTKYKTKLTYKLVSVSKKAKGYIKVSSNGKVTVKKGLAKGTYKIKVKITAAKTKTAKKATTTKVITLKVS